MSKTIGIQMVVDCSGSMNETDMLFEGKRRSRIDLVRELSKEFVLGNGADLKGRMNDTIGVIAFADFPTTLCPLMPPDRNMRSILERIGVSANADGTAIGDAVAVAAARFHHAESTASESFRSKAIVLLTDGENNSGKRTVAEAAALAKEWGVRIYAIAIRPTGRQPNRADPAWDDLELLADASGGLARLVTSGSSLQTVYREIDKLERSDRQRVHFSGGWELIYALAAAGLLLLLAEITLTQKPGCGGFRERVSFRQSSGAHSVDRRAPSWWAALYLYGDRRRRAALALWSRSGPPARRCRRSPWKRALQIAACCARSRSPGPLRNPASRPRLRPAIWCFCSTFRAVCSPRTGGLRG